MYTLSTINEQFVLRRQGESVNCGDMVTGVILQDSETLTRAYFEGEFNVNNPTPPICFSGDGVRPDSRVVKPICKTCAVCPNNAWGSSKYGKGKACVERTTIQVVLCDTEYQMVTFRLNVHSLKKFQEYKKTLKKRSCDIETVMTNIFIDKTATKANLVSFSFAYHTNSVDDEAIGKLKQYYTDAPAFVEVQGLNNQHNL